MSKALEGEHYCEAHQGNHSHYDPKNCALCKAEARIAELEGALEEACSYLDEAAGKCGDSTYSSKATEYHVLLSDPD